MDLTFNVCKQIITRTDTEKVVNLSDNYLRLVFTFQGTDWDDLAKFILVHHRAGVTRIGLVENAVTLPRGLLNTDRLVFTVYGVDDEDENNETRVLVTANKQVVYLMESGYVDEYSDIIDVIEVDTVEQIYIAINAKADKTYTDNQLATKVAYTDIIDGLTSNETGKPLSAKQGKVLKDLIDANNVSTTNSLATKVAYSDIKDNLTSTDTNKPLSANQGKELKTLVDTKANSTDMITALDGKSNVGHNHLESDITDLKNYSVVGHTHTKENITDFAHNHDDRYYTETETNTLLNGKSNTGHTHTKSEVTDFAHNHDDRYYTESEIDTKLNGKANSTHNHTKSDVTDFTHTHTKSEVTDFTHTHSKSEITDFSHNHDERYYTESEVDALIYSLNNKVMLSTDKILQTGDTIDFRAYVVENGMPQQGKVVKFYIDEEEEE